MGFFSSLGSMATTALGIPSNSGPWGTITGTTPADNALGASGGSSGVFASAADFLGNQLANRQNIEQANHQMEFQASMSNTAYQRAVADMKKAGINPMLAALTGGASTPGGSAAQVTNSAGTAVRTGLQSALTSAQLDNIAADTSVKVAQARKTGIDADFTAGAQTQKTLADVINTQSLTDVNRQQLINLQAQLPQIAQSIDLMSKQALQASSSAASIDFDNVGRSIQARLLQQYPILKQSDVIGNNSIFQAIQGALMRFVSPININKSYNWQSVPGQPGVLAPSSP